LLNEVRLSPPATASDAAHEVQARTSLELTVPHFGHITPAAIRLSSQPHDRLGPLEIPCLSGRLPTTV
jgi:hypothetical protein